VIGLPLISAEGAALTTLGIAAVGRQAATAIPTAANAALSNTIGALFKAGDEIAGGTAGAIRNEAITGQATRGVFHLQKGIERIAHLERILRRETLSAADRATAERLLGDLRDAVNFARERAGP
jgi:hypothetical protein